MPPSASDRCGGYPDVCFTQSSQGGYSMRTIIGRAVLIGSIVIATDICLSTSSALALAHKVLQPYCACKCRNVDVFVAPVGGATQATCSKLTGTTCSPDGGNNLYSKALD